MDLLLPLNETSDIKCGFYQRNFMSLIMFGILFFCLVSVGIFIPVKAIRMLKSVFNGIMFSENYGSISYPDVTDMDIAQQLLVNRAINIRTGSETHNIVLLLSQNEKMNCFKAIQETLAAAKKRRLKRQISDL
jgi:hypothetical protein